MTIQQLREQRKAKALAAKNLLDQTEGKEWTQQNQELYDQILAEIDAIDKKIERHEKIFQLETQNAQRIDNIAGVLDISDSAAEVVLAMENECFVAFLKGGVGNLTEKHRAFLAERRRVSNAMSVGVTTEGGYTVPAQFGGMLIDRMKAFGGIREIAQVRQTASGASIPWPTADTTAQEGEIVGENTSVSGPLDVTFGTLDIPTYKYSSKSVAVPFELLNDNAVDLENYIVNLLATRLSRITNRHYVTGTGTGQPYGVLTKAGLGATAAAAAAISFDDLIELEHSVDPAYRVGNSVAYAFNDATLKLLRKLKDSTGRPLFQPGVDGAAYNTINNRRYVILQEMPSVGTGLKSVLFGQFDNYLIRDVPMAVDMFRMTDSKYTEKGQVGFLAFSRHGGGLLDEGAKNGGTGAHSIKYLVHP